MAWPRQQARVLNVSFLGGFLGNLRALGGLLTACVGRPFLGFPIRCGQASLYWCDLMENHPAAAYKSPQLQRNLGSKTVCPKHMWVAGALRLEPWSVARLVAWGKQLGPGLSRWSPLYMEEFTFSSSDPRLSTFKTEARSSLPCSQQTG